MTRVLTEEQKQMVADNHNLIYAFLNMKHLSTDETEDWYGIAAIGLCDAAIAYDKTRDINFSTLAFKCMQRMMTHAIEHIKAHEAPNIMSLDQEIEGTENLVLGDLIPDRSNYEDIALISVAVSDVFDSLSDRDRDIVGRILNGKTQTEVADIFGYSKQTISNVYHAFMNKVMFKLHDRIVY